MSGAAVRAGTILFTDLVGFTEFTDVYGDLAALEVLDRQQTLIGSALDGIGECRIVKELGDGLMIWFVETVDGLEAARRILRSIDQARRAASFSLNLRMGMHAGDVIERGSDYIGQTVNIASRICDLAGPGELVVSEPVVQAVPDAADRAMFRPIGPVRVKGVGTPIWLYRHAS